MGFSEISNEFSLALLQYHQNVHESEYLKLQVGDVKDTHATKKV